MHILLVEDDVDLGETLIQILEENGFTVNWAQSGDEAVYLMDGLHYDLMILDRLLPALNGLEVLASIRRSSDVPVLMLTALNTLADRVQGLDAGADDYLGKPFELPELLARVRSLVRRGPRPIQENMVHGTLLIDPMARTVSREGKPVELSRIEFDAACYLLKNKGRVVSREELERLLYDERELRANPVDVLVHRIRKKLGKQFIRTRRGVGYEVGPAAS